MKIPSKLDADAVLAKKTGDGAGAEEFSQLWRVLMDVLDQIVGSAGERTVDSDGFLQLLRIAFSETDIGSIPTSVDEVIIGGAANTRPQAKAVYILGATDGVFPKRECRTTGFFPRTKRRSSAKTESTLPQISADGFRMKITIFIRRCALHRRRCS